MSFSTTDLSVAQTGYCLADEDIPASEGEQYKATCVDSITLNLKIFSSYDATTGVYNPYDCTGEQVVSKDFSVGECTPVVASFTASGDVSDFDDATKRTILEKLAQLAGFSSAPFGSTLDITAGSVIIVAKFPVVTQSEASSARSSLEQSSVAAGQDAFEAQMRPILAVAGSSIESTVAVEVKGDSKPTESGGSPVVAIAAAAAGVAVVAALLGVCYKKNKRRGDQPSNLVVAKMEQGGMHVSNADAEALTMAQKVSTIAEQLKVDGSSPLATTVAACNQAIGITGTGTLAQQVDTLMAQLGRGPTTTTILA